jgi:hypothetical protein
LFCFVVFVFVFVVLLCCVGFVAFVCVVSVVVVFIVLVVLLCCVVFVAFVFVVSVVLVFVVFIDLGTIGNIGPVSSWLCSGILLWCA